MSLGNIHHNIVNCSFSVKIEFRSLHENGILIYASAVDMAAYFTIYLYHGLVTMQMRTQVVTHTVQLKYRYNDGKWWKVFELRLLNIN